MRLTEDAVNRLNHILGIIIIVYNNRKRKYWNLTHALFNRNNYSIASPLFMGHGILMRFKSRYARAIKEGFYASSEYLSSGDKKNIALYSRMSSYSQCGEDLLLKSFFDEQFPPDYKGAYIDVGCFHPFRYSNTCIFYQSGWRGLNIDPTPGVMKLFSKYRPEDINVPAAISNSSEPVVLNIFNEGAVNSIDPDLSKSREGHKGWTIVEKKTITPIRLEQALDQHWQPDRPIDFLDIDVEGLDYEVLLSNNWKKYRPRFVLVEDETPLATIGDSKIVAFMNDQGYSPVAASRLSKIFSLK